MRRLKAKVAPTHDTPFTRETEPWGARVMISVQPRHPDIAATVNGKNSESPNGKGSPSRLSVVSYNVLADSNSFRVSNCPQSMISWGRRREILLKEIFSVRADLICLQDVDVFHQWWSPQLTSAGYDSLFKQRTSKGQLHRDGVVIAWKRDVFDLFRSAEMDLNRLGEDEEDRSLAGKAANSDNVALMTLLQPWQDSEHPSGACVVCTQLHDEQGHSGDAVRVLQACGLTRTIEAFNSDFHLPVILCGTMNCLPSSGAYEILCRGLEAQDPSRPGPPGKPLVEPLSTSSAHLRWAVPQDDHEALNPLIDLYKLLWIPGGSRFLLGEGVAVPEADCLVYDLVETKSGNVRSEQNRLRSFIATGLSSGIAYEFRVAAVNALGQGPWSERSEPVHMPRIAGNDPEYGVLLGAASIKLVRERELEEVRRRAEERLADPRAYQLRKLVKIAGLLDVGAENLHPFDSVSGMTPRYSDAVLHPDSANVRTDTGFPSIIPSTLGDNSSNVSSVTTGRRRRRKEKGAPDESYGTHSTGDKNTSNTEEWNSDAKSEDASGSAPRADGCRKELKPSSHRHTTTDASPEESGSCRAASYAKSVENGTKPSRWLDHAPPCAPLVSECGASEEGGVPEAYFGREKKLLLRLAALNVSGKRSSRQKHALGLRSAYMSHCSGGEPAFTALSDKFSGTVDYIFFSAACLLPEGVLSLPEIGSLVGQDVQQTELAPIPGLWVPKKWQAEHTKEGYTGEWSPLLRENPLKVRHKIPNDVFPSDHLMLMANLVYFEPRCPSTWR